jgi:hypothetical protein
MSNLTIDGKIRNFSTFITLFIIKIIVTPSQSSADVITLNLNNFVEDQAQSSGGYFSYNSPLGGSFDCFPACNIEPNQVSLQGSIGYESGIDFVFSQFYPEDVPINNLIKATFTASNSGGTEKSDVSWTISLPNSETGGEILLDPNTSQEIVVSIPPGMSRRELFEGDRARIIEVFPATVSRAS